MVWLPGRVAAQEPPGQRLALDLGVQNPDDACNDIRSNYSPVVGEDFTVAVCLVNAPEPPAAVTFLVLYDDRIVVAPNLGECDGDTDEADDLFATPVPGAVASVEESLDCNPDANTGRTTFGPTDLGDNWDCTAGGLVEPWGNSPAAPGAVFNGGCISPAGPYRLGPTAPVAMMTFRAQQPGRTALTLAFVGVVGASGAETGSCAPVTDVDMPCAAGVITVEGASTAPSDSSGEDGWDPPWGRIGALVGFAILFLAGAGLWFRGRTRRQKPGSAA